MIVGTAAYMSPEQAKGREVDRRTDIFAFGAVLYEMLTGQQAFGGEDVTQILARILEREPDWTLLPPNVPPRVRELLRLCLQKDIKKRRSDAADVRIDIEQALSGSPETVEVPAASRTRERLWISALSLVTLIAVVLAVPAEMYIRETPPAAPPEMRLEIGTPATSDPASFALSPDGRQIVFVASGGGQPRLWLRALDKLTAQPLTGTEGASYPFWSPDSKSIGFFDGTRLKRIDIGGGSPQTLTND